MDSYPFWAAARAAAAAAAAGQPGVQVVLEPTQRRSIRRPRDICQQLIAFIISVVGIEPSIIATSISQARAPGWRPRPGLFLRAKPLIWKNQLRDPLRLFIKMEKGLPCPPQSL